jgi:PIN domain nuclease of toxin-antitoxin system
MIILDTHALIWWLSKSGKLSKKAKQAIDKASSDGQIYVSSMSIWEVCMLFKKERIKLNTDIDEWIKKVVNLPMIKVVDVNVAIANQSVFLEEYVHPDPVDRIIIATAQLLKIPLVTADKKITRSKIVKVIW